MDKKVKTTSSIYMTAAFLALGAKLEDIDKTDPKHMVFSLSDDSGLFSPPITYVTTLSTEPSEYKTTGGSISEHNLDVWEKSWANGTLMVNAVKFMEAIQRLKSIIHAT